MDIQQEFFEACKIDDFNKVKSLLFNAIVINFYKISDNNNFAIQLATTNCYFNIVKLLLFTTMR